MFRFDRDGVYRVLEKADTDDDLYKCSRVFDIFILTLIVLNVLAVILETVAPLAAACARAFHAFEVFSVAVFTIEYVLRLWSCTSQEEYRGRLIGRLSFAVSIAALIDLVAIAPFYVGLVLPLWFPTAAVADLRFVRVLRLFRLLRLLKAGRYSQTAKTLGNVLRNKKEELVITTFAVAILLIFASSLMYLVENEAQPDQFSSIPAAMWWGIATLTTVGYGDIYPVTVLGKVLGAVIALLGIGMFALPAGIFASAFEEELKRRRGKATACPHCGKRAEDPPDARADTD